MRRNNEFVVSNRVPIRNSEHLWGSFALGFCKKKKKSRIFSYSYHFSFAKWPTLTTGSKFYLQRKPFYNAPQSHHHQHRHFWGYQDRMWNHVPFPTNKAFYKRKSSKSWVSLSSVPGCLFLSGPRLVDDISSVVS